MSYSLAELAERFGLELKGDGATQVHGVCTLAPGKPGHLGFLASPKYRAHLASTQASAVIVSPRDAAALQTAGLVAAQADVAFARVARLFDRYDDFIPGVDPTAAVDAGASIAADAHVGPQVAIGAGAVIGPGVYVGAGTTVGRGARVGAGTRLEARVVVADRVTIGERCRISPGAVIGGRGFGLARGPAGWVEMPQVGSVVIGNDVEVGSNTCIDRGAIEDTVIEDGVKLDNLIQIAHNVRIGAHTAMAGCAAVAGSTRIGARCMIGGAAVITGHLEIADEVVVLGYSMVTHSLLKKGVYGSGLPVTEAREWRRSIARLRRLDHLQDRLENIEQHLKIVVKDEKDEPDEDQL